MPSLRRLFYLFYYLMNSDIKRIKAYLNHTSAVTGKPRVDLIIDIFRSVFRYNISIVDYFSFRFFGLNDFERNKWAGTGFMYEYQLKMNPKSTRIVLENKIRFLMHFKPFVKREFRNLNELIDNQDVAVKMLACSSRRLVLKGSNGQIGKEVKVIDSSDCSYSSLIRQMKEENYDLAEEYVVQHRSLMELSPSGLNTIRIITQLNNGVVEFLGARLRISVNSSVDNMAAGNLAAPVDIETGLVNGPGVYSDITNEDRAIHPITGQEITGFTIPYWNEVVELAKNAAFHTTENRSVGWDIAITDDGPELIEGNHNWCKLLWQLPVKKGLKNELEKYI